MEISDLLKRFLDVANKMSLILTNQIDNTPTERIYEQYKRQYGNDHLTKEYEQLTDLLGQHPLMVD